VKVKADLEAAKEAKLPELDLDKVTTTPTDVSKDNAARKPHVRRMSKLAVDFLALQEVKEEVRKPRVIKKLAPNPAMEAMLS